MFCDVCVEPVIGFSDCLDLGVGRDNERLEIVGQATLERVVILIEQARELLRIERTRPTTRAARQRINHPGARPPRRRRCQEEPLTLRI